MKLNWLNLITAQALFLLAGATYISKNLGFYRQNLVAGTWEPFATT